MVFWYYWKSFAGGPALEKDCTSAMEKELISIVIPMYNTREYLAECLESVGNQRHSNFECIIVDDGSTDGSWEIVQDYSRRDPRFRLIRQKHAGVAAAVSRGIAEAAGQWLYFLDSDDWIDADELEFLYALVRENRCDMASSNYILEDGRSEISSIVRFRGAVEKESFPELFYPQFLCNEHYSGIVCGNTRGGKLIRRELARENAPFQLGLDFAEDAVLMLAILCDCRRVYGAPSHAGYHYRQHASSSTHSYGLSYVAHRTAYAQRLRQLYVQKGIAGHPALEENYLRFSLYNVLGSLQAAQFDTKAIASRYPEAGKWIRDTARDLYQREPCKFGLRNACLMWMLRHGMFRLISLLYRANQFLRQKRGIR